LSATRCGHARTSAARCTVGTRGERQRSKTTAKRYSRARFRTSEDRRTEGQEVRSSDCQLSESPRKLRKVPRSTTDGSWK
jgi:hypothetical protein